MAHKTIYRCTETGNQLELAWSDAGIHFNLTQEDGTYLCDLQFDEFDIETMIEELELYKDAHSKTKNQINENTGTN